MREKEARQYRNKSHNYVVKERDKFERNQLQTKEYLELLKLMLRTGAPK